MRRESSAVLLGFWEASLVLFDAGPGMPVGNTCGVSAATVLCQGRSWDKQQQQIHPSVSVQLHLHGSKGEGKKLKLKMCISN